MNLNDVELFVAGQQIDSSGMSIDWPLERLKEIALAYNEAVSDSLHDAPAIVQHDGKKAIGWAKNLRVAGQKLVGDFVHMSDELVQGLKDFSLRKRSIGLYPPEHPQNPTPGRWNLRHVAFVPVPAVKGMADIDPSKIFSEANWSASWALPTDGYEPSFDFSAPTDGLFEFSYPDSSIVSVVRALREWLISDKGLEVAEKILPNYLIQDLALDTAGGLITRQEFDAYIRHDSGEMGHHYYSEGETGMQTVDQLKEVVGMRDRTIDALQKQVAQLTRQIDESKVTNYVESLVQKGVVPAGRKESEISKILEIPNTAESAFSFSEGGESKKVTPRQMYMDQLASQAEIVSTGSLVEPGDRFQFGEGSVSRADVEAGFDSESVKLDRAVQKIAADKGINFSEALDIYMKTAA